MQANKDMHRHVTNTRGSTTKMVANEADALAQKKWQAPWLSQEKTMAEHLKAVHGLGPRGHSKVIGGHKPDNWNDYTTQVSTINQEVVEPRRGYSGAWPNKRNDNKWAQHSSNPTKKNRRFKKTKRTGVKSRPTVTKLPKFGPENQRIVNPNLEARYRARVYTNLKSTVSSLRQINERIDESMDRIKAARKKEAERMIRYHKEQEQEQNRNHLRLLRAEQEEACRQENMRRLESSIYKHWILPQQEHFEKEDSAYKGRWAIQIIIILFSNILLKDIPI